MLLAGREAHTEVALSLFFMSEAVGTQVHQLTLWAWPVFPSEGRQTANISLVPTSPA